MSNTERNETSLFDDFSKGVFKENPILVLLIGLCPTLAVSTTVVNAVGMGIAVIFVLFFSNVLVSMLKDYIPEKVRIPGYIIIIASFVTIADLLLNAFLPAMAKSLGVYVPLIVVNCIIFARAEAFASKNNITRAMLDALGMGFGFLIGITLIALIREVLGTCIIDFSDYIKNPDWAKISLPFVNKDTSEVVINLFDKDYKIYSGAMLFISPAGALFVFGLLLAGINALRNIKEKIKKDIE
jgi:Na+-translocating ferredoxin:NAD+ oxidoreductase subunit E